MVRAEHQDLGAELGAQVRALKAEIDRGIRQLLQAGIDDGSVAVTDPKLAAFAIAGALNWIGHWFRAGRTLSAEYVAETFVQFLEQGLALREQRRHRQARRAVAAGAHRRRPDEGLRRFFLRCKKYAAYTPATFLPPSPIHRGRHP